MLQNYCATPHQSTGETPAMMLMNQELCTELPSMKLNKGKEYANRKGQAQGKDFKIGKKVLFTQ